MIYRFDRFELDPARAELRRDGESVPVEPQVFALLVLLAENRDRLVSRDEILEKVWEGRIVSDSVLASRIKSARRALDDDGKSQASIKTVHGRGFRFVADVREIAATGRAARIVAAEASRELDVAPRPSERPSIAILPFRPIGEHDATIADALADDLITELSRLRWLFVIARGSSFRFRSGSPDLEQVAGALGARYCLTGSVETSGGKLVVSVQLIDTHDMRVVWADRLTSDMADVHRTRATIAARLVAALELEIPAHEAELARLSDPESLDAWAAYHLGLQHVFRFHKADNDRAGALFERAVRLDPAFARAHAGLSFVHFQKAFLRYTADPDLEVQGARRLAERAVEIDARDPFVNFTMGRVHWIEGDLAASLPWLDRATALSPNYAQGIYARAWTHALCGRSDDSKRGADLAMALSPLDPLHYAMMATRALAHIGAGEDLESVEWAEAGARSPGAHVLIAVIAAIAHLLGGDEPRARAWAANVRTRKPDFAVSDFFRSFPFNDGATRVRIAHALSRLF